MTEFGVGELLDDDTLQKLNSFSHDQNEPDETDTKSVASRKDKRFTELLENSPLLLEKITSVMSKMAQQTVPMPVTHITPRAIRYEDGHEETTGYLENIHEHGFRARDTNVAAFVDANKSLSFRSPEYFAHNPHKLLRHVDQILERYRYHGTRTNKQSLGTQRDQGIGIPTMVVIDTKDVKLLKGSDYEDHFMIYDTVPPDHIMGVIDLDNKRSGDIEGIKSVTEDLLGQMEMYLAEEKK